MLGLLRTTKTLKYYKRCRFSTISDRETSQDKVYDVAVVGGGIAGSTLVNLLKSNPLGYNKRICVIETSKPKEINDFKGLDLRSYAITPVSKRIFEELGIWQNISEDDYYIMKKMQIWDSMGNGFIRFNSAHMNLPELGFIIENNLLQYYVHEKMYNLMKNNEDPMPLEIHCPVKVDKFQPATIDNPLASIALSNGQTLQAKLVVAADGKDSAIRKAAGFGTWGWDYDQSAVVAVVRTDLICEAACQRFLPTGPVAMLPMRDGYSNIIWSCTKEMAARICALSDEEFVSELNHAFQKPSDNPQPPTLPIPVANNILKGVGNVIDSFMKGTSLLDSFIPPPHVTKAVGKRFAFPLRLQHAAEYYKSGVVLVADSAHAIHPLAGQGLNIGLSDVDCLAKKILYGFETGQNITSQHGVLDEYERERKHANIAMSMSMDAFKRLFGNNNREIRMLRNLGMSTLQAIDPIKNKVMLHAMGF